MKSHKRRLHRIDHRIAEGVIFFLRAAYCVSLAGIAPQMAMLSEDMERFLKENTSFRNYLYPG